MLDFLPAARITTALSSLVRPARVLALAGLLCAGEAWCAVPDTIAERMRPCGACHGRESVATADGYSPRIAGKPAGYLLNQLRSFRDGRRTYAPMVYLVQYMSDAYLREIADYFAGLDLRRSRWWPPATRLRAARRSSATATARRTSPRAVPATVTR